MIAEISAAIASARGATDLLKAGYSLANHHQIVAAVSEVNAKLIGTQTAILASQEKQLALQEDKTALTKRISELEQKIMQLENWDRETERYQLCTLTVGTFTYLLKPDMENGEPSHHLCAHCFADKKKSILQFGRKSSYLRGYCQRCKAQVAIADQDAVRYFPELSRK